MKRENKIESIVSDLDMILLLDDRIFILKKEILAILQSTFITSNLFSLKNNLWSLYKLYFFFFLLFVQLQLLISTLYTKTFVHLFLMILLLQNTSLQITSSLQILIVFIISIAESMYYLLIVSIYELSSIITIIFLLVTSIKTKY